MQIISRFLDKMNGYVKLYYIDKTGNQHVLETRKSIIGESLAETLSNMIKSWKLLRLDLDDKKDFHPNMAVLNSKLVHARLLGGYSQFAATRVEWGWDATNPSPTDTDLFGSFLPRVYTNIITKEYPKDNMLKITTQLTNEVLTIPPSGPSSTYPFIREVGLKTNAITDPITNVNHPNGILIARYVTSTEYPKTSANGLGIQWLYIYS
jgi:hypothetical protein